MVKRVMLTITPSKSQSLYLITSIIHRDAAVIVIRASIEKKKLITPKKRNATRYTPSPFILLYDIKP